MHGNISFIAKARTHRTAREIKMSERFLVGPELNPKIKRGEQPKPKRKSIQGYSHVDQ